MRRSSIRLLGIAVAVLVGLFAASQVILPGLVAGDVEEKLTAAGGSAEVDVSAFPAVGLLLGGRGDRIVVRGRDIPLDLLTQHKDALDRLDGFPDVDVQIERLSAGPLRDATFSLRRSGDRDAAFRMRVNGRMTAEGLARYAGDRFGGPLGSLVGDLAGSVLPFGNKPLPVEIDAALVATDNGGVRITDGGGSVAGVPLGPFAELLVQALAARL